MPSGRQPSPVRGEEVLITDLPQLGGSMCVIGVIRDVGAHTQGGLFLFFFRASRETFVVRKRLH